MPKDNKIIIDGGLLESREILAIIMRFTRELGVVTRPNNQRLVKFQQMSFEEMQERVGLAQNHFNHIIDVAESELRKFIPNFVGSNGVWADSTSIDKVNTVLNANGFLSVIKLQRCLAYQNYLSGNSELFIDFSCLAKMLTDLSLVRDSTLLQLKSIIEEFDALGLPLPPEIERVLVSVGVRYVQDSEDFGSIYTNYTNNVFDTDRVGADLHNQMWVTMEHAHLTSGMGNFSGAIENSPLYVQPLTTIFSSDESSKVIRYFSRGKSGFKAEQIILSPELHQGRGLVNNLSNVDNLYGVLPPYSARKKFNRDYEKFLLMTKFKSGISGANENLITTHQAARFSPLFVWPPNQQTYASV